MQTGLTVNPLCSPQQRKKIKPRWDCDLTVKKYIKLHIPLESSMHVDYQQCVSNDFIQA
jgi:hypothetical protein